MGGGVGEGGKCHSEFWKILQFFAISLIMQMWSGLSHWSKPSGQRKEHVEYWAVQKAFFFFVQYNFKGISCRDIDTFLNTTRVLATDYTVWVYVVLYANLNNLCSVAYIFLEMVVWISFNKIVIKCPLFNPFHCNFRSVVHNLEMLCKEQI